MDQPDTENRASAAVAALARRRDRYRDMGWWLGERLQDRYARIVAKNPGGLAVADNRGHRFTHAELWDKAARLQGELEAHGVRPGEAVLLYMPNWAAWQAAFLAVLRCGAIPASLPVTTDADTLTYVADLVGASCAIAAKDHRGHAVGAVARAAAAHCRHALDLLTVDEHLKFSWSSPSAKARPPKPAGFGLDHLMFTSSTTGRPKAVMHTADTLAALNQTFAERFALGPDQPIFMASPLGHSVAAIHGARLAMYTGAPLVLQDRWDPVEALEMVANHGCAFTAAATPFLKDLVDESWHGAAAKLAPMRWFLCGGAQVPPTLMEQAAKEFPHTFVTVLWGMTEGGLTTCVSGSSQDQRLNTAGVGLPGLEVKVLGRDGERRPPGREGELVMRGPGVFVGYYGQQDLHASLLTADGFFRTEDLARIDADGYVSSTGRLKDLIIRGGVNISPVPAENVLAAHPDVLSVAVLGLPDERLGERICAVLVPRGDARPALDELVAFARARGLPKRQCPEALRYVDDMPRTAAGKVRKHQLRDLVAGPVAGAGPEANPEEP